MTTEIDFDARYSVVGYKGIAFYLKGWDTKIVYEGDNLVCDDDDCDHGMSEMCWTEGEYSIVPSDTMMKATMVGDDRVHVVDVDDLTKLDDDDYCHSCGQIGCSYDGRGD